MRLAIIGRTEWLYDAARRLRDEGHELALIVTAREAPEYTRTAADFRDLAAASGAVFVHSASMDSPDVTAAFARIGDVQLGVSMNYPSVIGADAIARLPFGILNAHGGDLPRYRGNACQAWAMLNGESQIGLCVHRMVGGELDAGDIVARAYRRLTIDDRIGEVLAWMGTETPRLFAEAVARLEADPAFTLATPSANPADGLRCYPRTPADGRIDWRQTSEQVLRLINASSEPYAGAFCEYDGHRLAVWRARLHDDGERYLAVPGQVAAIDRDDGSIVVTCGAGKLRITDVSFGNERGAAARFITSTRKRLHNA